MVPQDSPPPPAAPATGPASRADRSEYVFNLLLGLSLLGWAFARWHRSDPASHLAPVQWVVVALHACAGLLIMSRAPAARHGSPRAIAASLPCFVTGLWVMRHAPRPAEWPGHAAGVFVAGGLLAILSLLFLGRNFAIFPSVRGLTTRGPFALIRHPAYAGEMVMLAGCVSRRPGVIPGLLLLATVPMLAMRILAEERLLGETDGYRRYARRVRWRLVPGVW